MTISLLNRIIAANDELITALAAFINRAGTNTFAYTEEGQRVLRAIKESTDLKKEVRDVEETNKIRREEKECSVAGKE